MRTVPLQEFVHAFVFREKGVKFVRLNEFSRAVLSIAYVSAAVCATANSIAVPPSVPNAYKNQASAFVENKGQWDARVQFMSQTPGINQWITSEGVVLDFNRFIAEVTSAPSRAKTGHLEGHVVKMSFVNASPCAVTGEAELEGKNNYLLGNDESKWATGVRRFAEAHAEQPYNGISVRYYVDQGSPRYDLIVKPGADPSQVGLKIEGANKVRVLDNGDLAIDTSLGTVEEKGLTAYQETGGTKTPISCRMVSDGTTVRFDTGSYDPSKPLIIDPLIYSTLVGGTNGYNYIRGLGVTSGGNAVIASYSTSTNYPITTGAYQTKNSAAFGIGEITEFNATGTKLIFSTYLGGSASQEITALTLDAQGEAVVVGETSSEDFPITSGAFQTKNSAAPFGAAGFVTKLNASGNALIFSTFLGGNDVAGSTPEALTLDTSGSVYITGETNSTSFPTSSSAYQKVPKGAGLTCFLVKLSATGKSLIYGSLVGGSKYAGGTKFDISTSVALDPSGYAYIAGYTNASDFPVSATAYQAKNNAAVVTGAGFTGFVVKFNASASALLYSTYLGGNVKDYISGLAVDSVGNAIVVGGTFSDDFPTTAGALQTADSSASNQSCGFVTKLNGAGSSLAVSTFLGGTSGTNGASYVSRITLDGSQNIYLTGAAGNEPFPTTTNAYQKATGVATNAFLTELSPGALTVLYSTLLGGYAGGPGDGGDYVALNGTNGAMIAGIATTADFPTTAGAYQSDVDTYGEGFVASFTFGPNTADMLASFNVQPSVISGEQFAATVNLSGPAIIGDGIQMSLTTSGPISAPKYIRIQHGQASDYFVIQAQTVTKATTAKVTITDGTTSLTRDITVAPLVITSVTVSENPCVGGDPSGLTATVNLNVFSGINPGGSTQVKIFAESPLVAPSVVDLDDGTNYVQFHVDTKPVVNSTGALLEAQIGTQNQYITFDVDPALKSFSISPTSVQGGNNASGTVNLFDPAHEAQQVGVYAATDTGAASYMFVPQGASTLTFPITTSPVAATTTGSMTIEVFGAKIKANITLTPPPIKSLTFKASSVVGGTSTTGTVTLDGQTAVSGDVVSLSSSSADVTVPVKVTVPFLSTSEPFQITTKKVTATTKVTITAKFGSSTVSQVLTLTP